MEGLEPIFDYLPDERKPLLIAGPCSAESRDQVLKSAAGVASCGIRFFRAGIWKPRTKPGGFEGIGARGLPWLSEIKSKLSLEPVVEVASSAHLKCAIKHGIHSFWLGARTTANPFAVQEIADTVTEFDKTITNKITFLVKNPVNPDLDLWIGALERLYGAGLKKLGAVHRGFTAYGEHYYRNRPEWAIPLELKRLFPCLPLLCDPSHISGRRNLIYPISQQALDLNFDGLMIEVHIKPDDALSDGGQQISINELKALLNKLIIRDGENTEENLRLLREKIDTIDNDLISLLSERMEISREIGKLKKLSNMPVWQSGRYEALMSRFTGEAQRLGLSPYFIRRLLSLIHEESVKNQL